MYFTDKTKPAEAGFVLSRFQLLDCFHMTNKVVSNPINLLLMFQLFVIYVPESKGNSKQPTAPSR